MSDRIKKRIEKTLDGPNGKTVTIGFDIVAEGTTPETEIDPLLMGTLECIGQMFAEWGYRVVLTSGPFDVPYDEDDQ